MAKKSKNNNNANASKVMLTPNSPFTLREAYKSLRTNVAFSIPDIESKCIGVTSTNRSDGKSSVAVNLAISFAEIGKKVVLIDCDMRRPSVARKLGVRRTPGLSDYLVGEQNFNDCIYYVDELGFAVIPSGNIPPEPTSLLESKGMESLISVLRNHYDYVIVDLPPVSLVPDALILAKYIDGFLIVARHKKTEAKDLSNTIKHLQFADANIIGFVYNAKQHEGFKKADKSTYYYGY